MATACDYGRGICAAAILAGASAAFAEVDIAPIFHTGQPAIGFPNGAIIQALQPSWRRPLLNHRGRVALAASVTGGGVNALNDSGIWIADRAGQTLVLREDGLTLNLPPEVRIASISLFGFSDFDEALFTATLRGAGVDFTNDAVICRVRAGELPRVVAREGDLVPGGLSGEVWGFFATDVGFATPGNRHGEAVVRVGTNLRSGIWRMIGDELIPIVNEGDLAPGPSGAAMSSLGLRGWSDSGVAIVSATLTGGDTTSATNSAVFAFGRDSAAMIARRGDDAAEISEATFDAFNTEGHSGWLVVGDDAAFSCRVRGSGLNSTNNVGIWAGSAESLELLARYGQAAPDAPPNATFFDFFWLDAAAGGVGFAAHTQAGSGLFVAPTGGELRTIYLSGQPAPQTEPGTIYSGVESFGNDGPVRVDAFGRVTYLAQLDGASIPQGGLRVVYATDALGEAHRLVRGGDVIEIAAGVQRTVTILSNASMNSVGQVAVLVQAGSPTTQVLLLADVGCLVDGCAALDLLPDCRVDISDLAVLLTHFGGPGSPLDGDLDRDFDVDLDDLAGLLIGFGADCR